jgi:hypothetical protein
MNFFDRILCGCVATLFLFLNSTSVFPQASTFGGDAQHTGIFDVPAQTLNVIKWQTDINLVNTGELAHYGSPVITPNNTVLIAVRISATGFRIDAFNGATGALKYSLPTDFIMPAHGWVPSYNICLVGTRLYFAGAGGTVFHVDNVDSNTPTAPVREAFYGIANYNANPSGFNNSLFLNTPITADSAGNIFFGFRTQGTAPAPLNTPQSGLARLTPAGAGIHVLGATASGDNSTDMDSHNVGPALSNDESVVYFVFRASSNSLFSYLVGLNSTTLAPKHSVFLRDPVSNSGARVPDDATSSPMVAPDGDVYFGVLGNPNNGFRGYLLRFSGDLTTTKTPGHFGWDYTPGIVPASMVPSYTGTSSYLLFCKYNNYVSNDGSGGNGINRVAILDPNDTQPRPGAVTEMREVMTVIGFTRDDRGGSFPFAVKEFCINAPAVNPPTKSVFFDSEDGHLYRWNLETNSIDQAVTLSPGIGQPYVPTVIGPDGTVYTLNGGNFFAIGRKSDVEMTLNSSSPDLTKTVVGDSITFTATVTGGSQTPTGTVTFTDRSFAGTTPVTTTLATNVPLDANGRASITTSTLVSSGNNLGNHFITATYSGDASHTTTSATRWQKVHQLASAVTGSANGAVIPLGQPTTFNITMQSVPQGSGIPSGYITFFDNNVPIGSRLIDSGGQATFTTTLAPAGRHTVRVSYASDSGFAASESEFEFIVGPVVNLNNTVFSAGEGGGKIDVQVNLGNGLQSPVTVDYTTSDIAGASPCNLANGRASSRCDYITTRGTLTFNPGETQKIISVPIVDDAFVEGAETLTFTLSNVVGATAGSPLTATLTINDNDATQGVNPIDNASFFVRQHYLDFLSREPDTAGLNFWTNEITSCGSNAQCIEVKRVNVSAAFFLSTEFQQTGYLVYRIYKSSFGNLAGTPVPVVMDDFLAGTQTIGKNVQVGVGNWEAQLEANKVAFFQAFVQRPDFLAAYPNSMTAAQFVDKLNTNAAGVLSATERTNLINILGGTPADITKRAQVLRGVAEDQDLRNAEFNKAFVLMQYFGYLRRNPNSPPEPGSNFDGYNFWLNKLESFGGNFVTAELVKAFLISGEYRQRFGP